MSLPELSREEVARYSRHLILDEVGMEGQRRLKAASVLCVGTGGLGSPLLMYLASSLPNWMDLQKAVLLWPLQKSLACPSMLLVLAKRPMICSLLPLMNLPRRLLGLGLTRRPFQNTRARSLVNWVKGSCCDLLGNRTTSRHIHADFDVEAKCPLSCSMNLCIQFLASGNQQDRELFQSIPPRQNCQQPVACDLQM